MLSIWKFPIETTDEQTLMLPSGYTLLTVQTQADRPCIWALVDPESPKVACRVRTFGTGHPVDAPGRYLGTYQVLGGRGVFHVFAV